MINSTSTTTNLERYLDTADAKFLRSLVEAILLDGYVVSVFAREANYQSLTRSSDLVEICNAIPEDGGVILEMCPCVDAFGVSADIYIDCFVFHKEPKEMIEDYSGWSGIYEFVS